MRALLAALLALLPLAASAPLGHDEPSRTSAQTFPLQIDAVGLRDAQFDLSGKNCVVIRAQGHVAIHAARATLVPPAGEWPPPGRLMLQARASGAGPVDVEGALPLAMEMGAFTLAGHREEARLGVHLAEGAIAAAAGQRVDLRLHVEHTGAPISFAVDGCDPAP